MSKVHQITVKHSQKDDSGVLRTIKEIFIVESLTFTDAEATISQLVEDGELAIDGGFTIPSIKPVGFSDFIGDEFDDNVNFKVTASFISIDENAGKEKKIKQHMLVNGEDIYDALEKLKEALKGFTVPYTIEAIATVNVSNVYMYEK